MINEESLVPIEILYAVPPLIAANKRGDVLFRIRQIGASFFVEQSTMERKLVDGKESVDKVWKTVAIAKDADPMKARDEAIVWMLDAHKQALQLSAGPSSARGGASAKVDGSRKA